MTGVDAKRTGSGTASDADLDVRRQLEVLRSAFLVTEGDKARPSPFDACLGPLLEALGWPADSRCLVEARPHLDAITDLGTLRAVLLRLGFASRCVKLTPDRLMPADMPAILLRERKPLLVLGASAGGVLKIFDPLSGKTWAEPAGRQKADLVLISRDETSSGRAITGSWFLRSLSYFRGEIASIALLALICNLMAIATPLFTASVYNHVIGARAIDSLVYFLLLIGIVLAFEIHFRRMKARLVAYVGARFNAGIAVAALEKLLSLPISRIDQASAVAQIQRLRQFERVRGFFSGNVANAIVELPFTLVFLLLLAGFGVPFLAIPLALIAAYGALSLILLPAARRQGTEAGKSHADAQTFLAEAFSRIDTIRQLGAERIWSARYQALCQRSTIFRFRMQALDNTMQALSQALFTLAGMATLGFGTQAVIAGQISLGGLIAVMMLIWRLLAPIQQIFLGLSQTIQFIDTVRQINALMQIPAERADRQAPAGKLKSRGEIVFERVSFRYPGRMDLTLSGVTLKIAPGEVVAICGPAGSGKSTLLKMLLGFYPPAAGTISLDGINLQQIGPARLRTGFAYLPQNTGFFYGTIEQNLRLAEPGASRSDLMRALARAGLGNISSCFPEGLETRIAGHGRTRFSNALLARLALARIYVRQASVILLDDPGADLDQPGDAALIATLAEMRDKATIILVSNRPSQIRVCSRAIVLDRGQIVADGAPDGVLRRHFPPATQTAHQVQVR